MNAPLKRFSLIGRIFDFAKHEFLRRSLPHGLVSPRYLLPFQPLRVRIHRRFRLRALPRIPLFFYLPMEGLAVFSLGAFRRLAVFLSHDHHVLYTLAEKYIPDRLVLRLTWQYLGRTVCFEENYREITRGISLGCPLSPLVGALYLKPLDDAVAETGLFYARFMDDWVIVAPSRWKLRKVVRIVNQTLSRQKVEKHPDKTFIGRVEKGFYFLGYHLKPESLAPSCQTIKKHAEQICRLYEQGAGIDRIRQYIWRWYLWLKFGFGQLKTLFLGIQISFMASLRLFFFKG